MSNKLDVFSTNESYSRDSFRYHDHTESGTYFLTAIFGIPFINDVLEWGEIIIAFIRINTIINCDEANIMLWKVFFCIGSGKGVTTIVRYGIAFARKNVEVRVE